METELRQQLRAYLLAEAEQAGLREASATVEVLPREPLPGCAGTIGTQPIDVRQYSRMRFTATCSEPAWQGEVIVRGRLEALAVVAASALPARQPIDAAALRTEMRDVTATPEAFSDPQAVAGREARRALREGQVISARLLVEPLLVARSANVRVLARKGGVSAEVAGEALESGRLGQIIRVRNKVTDRVIRARVVAENLVEPVSLSTP